jgi:hypothetical protein
MERQNVLLETFLEKFPPEKYIQVLPQLVLKDALPPYLSFAIEVVRVDPADKRQAYAPPGVKASEGLALSGIIWEQFGTALGLKWIPDLCHRLDDGRDRRYCHFQSGAVLSNIAGMIPLVGNYDFHVDIYEDQEKLRLEKYPPEWTTWKLSAVRPDLLTDGRDNRNARFGELSAELQEKFLDLKVRENVLQKEQFLLRLCESGSRLRVIRKITGLPHVFSPQTLAAKAFAILKVIIRIQPETEAERVDLNRRLMDRMYPAYGLPAPSGGVAELGSGDTPRAALGAGQDEEPPGSGPKVVEFEIEADEPESPQDDTAPQDQPLSPAAGVGSPLTQKSDICPPEKLSAVEESAIEDFIRDVREYLIELKDLIGEGEAKKVVGDLLREGNYNKIREVKESEYSGFLSILKSRLDSEIKKTNEAAQSPAPCGSEARDERADSADRISTPPGDGDPDAPFWAGKNYASIMDITARRLPKTSDAELREGISRMIEETKYDADKDPIALSAIMGAGAGKTIRAGLQDAYMRMVEYGITSARRK